MPLLEWKKVRSIENSLAEFFQDVIDTDSLTVQNDNGTSTPISIRVGYEFNDDWNLPVISFYFDSKTAPRDSIGSSRRLKTYFIILDIRALNKGMQLDLAEWVEQTINSGFPVYDYTPSLDLYNPTKIQNGHAAVEFVSITPLKLGEGVDLVDKYRTNIVVSIFIENEVI